MAHEAEAEVFVIQKWECGAVADHEALADAVIKEGIGIDAFFYAAEHEVGQRFIDFDSIPGAHFFIDGCALGVDMLENVWF